MPKICINNAESFDDISASKKDLKTSKNYLLRDGREEAFISLAKAASYCSYSQDYLSLLARKGILKSQKLGRNWFTKKAWLLEYLKRHPKSVESMKAQFVMLKQEAVSEENIGNAVMQDGTKNNIGFIAVRKLKAASWQVFSWLAGQPFKIFFRSVKLWFWGMRETIVLMFQFVAGCLEPANFKNQIISNFERLDKKSQASFVFGCFFIFSFFASLFLNFLSPQSAVRFNAAADKFVSRSAESLGLKIRDSIFILVGLDSKLRKSLSQIDDLLINDFVRSKDFFVRAKKALVILGPGTSVVNQKGIEKIDWADSWISVRTVGLGNGILAVSSRDLVKLERLVKTIAAAGANKVKNKIAVNGRRATLILQEDFEEMVSLGRLSPRKLAFLITKGDQAGQVAGVMAEKKGDRMEGGFVSINRNGIGKWDEQYPDEETLGKLAEILETKISAVETQNGKELTAIPRAERFLAMAEKTKAKLARDIREIGGRLGDKRDWEDEKEVITVVVMPRAGQSQAKDYLSPLVKIFKEDFEEIVAVPKNLLRGAEASQREGEEQIRNFNQPLEAQETQLASRFQSDFLELREITANDISRIKNLFDGTRQKPGFSIYGLKNQIGDFWHQTENDLGYIYLGVTNVLRLSASPESADLRIGPAIETPRSLSYPTPTAATGRAATSEGEIGIEKNMGAVVAPLNETESQEETVERLKKVFSEEVRIKSDADKGVGVIEPIYPATPEEKYLYVVVPVRE